MQLQPPLCSLAWGPQGLGFPQHHNCQSHLLLHMHAESQATTFSCLETIPLVISRSLHSTSFCPVQALFLAHVLDCSDLPCCSAAGEQVPWLQWWPEAETAGKTVRNEVWRNRVLLQALSREQSSSLLPSME